MATKSKKSSKSKVLFASVTAASMELATALSYVLEAEGEKQNAQALLRSASDMVQAVITQTVQSGYTVANSPRGESDGAMLRRHLHEFFAERGDLSKQSKANAVSSVAKAINGYETGETDKKGKPIVSHRFRGLNPARYLPKAGSGGGPLALIVSSDSAYAINAKRDDTAERLAGAVSQFGAWIMSVVPENTPAEDPRVMLAAYLKDAIDVTNGVK